MNLNIGLLRTETPACEDLVHFNNAGAALQPRPVTEAQLNHLELEQRIGGYEAAVTNSAQIENFYTAFATLFNCSAHEIAYAENSTRAWTQLLLSISFEPGERILVGQAEYASNYLSLLHLARFRDIRIEVIPNNSEGTLCLTTLEQKLDDNVRLVALTHIGSQSGSIQPAEQVGQLLKGHRALYILDACQAAGQLQLDVQKIGCDMLTGSGRKYLRGPRGTGFLYVRHSILEDLTPPAIDLLAADWISPDRYELRNDARRFEMWEQNIAGKIALGVAVGYANQLGMAAIEKRIRKMATLLRQQLAEIPGVRIHDQGVHLGGIVSFSLDGMPAATLQQKLHAERINTSVIRRQSAQLDFTARQLGDINRASVHYYNTESEIERFCALLRTD